MHAAVAEKTKKVIYDKNRSRVSIRGWPCNNFPRIQFDHHAKFCCSFSTLDDRRL